ncbi:MAG: DUF3137 domain-containing protein [Lentisphaeria bacterium]|nr:DUF3137 domain-containing protein [Lentisphaeria bacterium]
MGLFDFLVGPSKDEVWSRVATDLGTDYIDGGFFSKDEVRYQFDDWEILLDTFTRSSKSTNGHSSFSTYTRMQAPFVNPTNFDFNIYRESIFSPLGKWLGMQDIKIGDTFFDNDYIIKSNNPNLIKEVLTQNIRELIRMQPNIHFEIQEGGSFFCNLPEGVDILYFEAYGVIKDEHKLKLLFELFMDTLKQLHSLGISQGQTSHSL